MALQLSKKVMKQQITVK